MKHKKCKTNLPVTTRFNHMPWFDVFKERFMMNFQGNLLQTELQLNLNGKKL